MHWLRGAGYIEYLLPTPECVGIPVCFVEGLVFKNGANVVHTINPNFIETKSDYWPKFLKSSETSAVLSTLILLVDKP